MPATNLLTLREFEREWRSLAIRTGVTADGDLNLTRDALDDQNAALR
jgi:hypothetical protein